MDKAVAGRIEDQVRSAFPAGVIGQVEVLDYGDDPDVEPGESGVRACVAGAGRRVGREPDKILAFEEAHRAAIRKLRDELPRPVGWVEFRPDRPDWSDGPILRTGRPRREPKTPGGGPEELTPVMRRRGPAEDEGPEELTPVMTRLGPADLAAVDTLITAGVANSRAEVLRWAVGRIREHPVYVQLQERVHEINELKAQF